MHKDKPSMTARKVALNVVTLGAKEGMDKVLPPGLVESTADMLVASGVVGPKAIKFARSRRALSVYEWLDWMLPGQFEAFAHRKALCEHQVRDGISAGALQILNLGAGYDTMGWRLAPDFPGVNFVEIDHPATARLKARGVDKMGQRDNLILIAEDLGERKLVDVLNAHDLWNVHAQTVIIAEGLVMYLRPEAVRDLFSQCAAITGPGSRIVFSYFSTGQDGRPNVGPYPRLMLWLQKAVGEPWLWSIRPEELGLFLEGLGWKNVESPETNRKYGVEYYGVAAK